MKLSLFLSLIAISAQHVSAQVISKKDAGVTSESTKESPKEDKGKEEDTEFYYFEIPSAINGSNLDPSAISNISSNFTDSKLSLKIGIPTFFKEVPKDIDLTHTGFFQPYVKATNSVATLWSANSRPTEFGATAGYSYIFSRRKWVYLENDLPTDKHSSESIKWVNVIVTAERGNYNIFDESRAFANLVEKRTESNLNAYITFNRYFFSQIKRFKRYSNILSLGLGYAKTNNYISLKTRTLEEGRIIYNSDSSRYQSVVETTSGRVGKFEVYQGLTFFGELFLPIIRNRTIGSIYWGNQASYYGIGANNYIINGTTGFYFNLKDRKIVDNKAAKDIANFSIVGRFKQLNKLSETNYADDNFSIVLQAAIPITFN